MPTKWPDNWLDWLTLAGACAGIASATKLFLSNTWLNNFQRVALVAANQAVTKDIMCLRVLGGDIRFHLAPKEGDRPNDFYNEINNLANGEIGQSRVHLAYLEELVRKGLFVYIINESGIPGMKNESYALTAKGIRYASLLKCFVPVHRYSK